jgi:hypothetical protein
MDSVTFRAEVLRTKDVLANPEAFEGLPILVIQTTPGYLSHLRSYAKLHSLKNAQVTMREMPTEWTERAKNFMFMVRDKVAVASGEDSKEYRIHLYMSAKEECGFFNLENGVKRVKSIKELTRDDLTKLTDLFLDWAEAAGVDRQQFAEEQRELRESRDDSE